MQRRLTSFVRSALAVAALAGAASPAPAQVPEIAGISAPSSRTDGRLLVRRPLRISHNGGWQSLVFTPLFEGAEVAPARRGFLAAHYQAARTDITTQGANVYRGTFHDVTISGGLGITDQVGPIEAKFDFSIARLAAADHEISATYDGAQVVPGSWSGGGSLRRAAFGLKIGIYDDRSEDLAVSTTGWAKVPIDGDDHLTDTGELELGAVIAISHGMRVPGDAAGPNLYFHAHLGAMWRQNQDVFGTRVRPNSAVVWAAGAVALMPDLPVALIAQVEGSSNPFNELDDYNSDPATVSLGTRIWSEGEGSNTSWMHGLMLELAVSFGLAGRNGVDTALTAGLGYHF